MFRSLKQFTPRFTMDPSHFRIDALNVADIPKFVPRVIDTLASNTLEEVTPATAKEVRAKLEQIVVELVQHPEHSNLIVLNNRQAKYLDKIMRRMTQPPSWEG